MSRMSEYKENVKRMSRMSREYKENVKRMSREYKEIIEYCEFLDVF
jgi:hypothetical protein